MPAGQAAHELELLLLEKKFIGQSVHAAEPSVEKVPALQTRQDAQVPAPDRG